MAMLVLFNIYFCCFFIQTTIHVNNNRKNCKKNFKQIFKKYKMLELKGSDRHCSRFYTFTKFTLYNDFGAIIFNFNFVYKNIVLFKFVVAYFIC